MKYGFGGNARVVLSLFIILFGMFFLCSADDLFADINALEIDRPPDFDGRLDEDFWSRIEPTSDFTQHELYAGSDPSEPTEVRIAYDEDNLYIGLMCYDSQPDNIVHNQLRYDGNITNDDCVIIVLDTYNDNRMGYMFIVNPNGARLDATIRGGEDDSNVYWDGIWDARSKITPEGWSSEVRIPFKTLRFPTSRESQIWGVNFQRYIQRTNEQIRWRGWDRDDRLFQLVNCGDLSFEQAPKSGIHLDVTPYVLGGIEDTPANTNPGRLGDVGLDARYGVNSNTEINVTYNTDFAQIESDDEMINLNRFDLFYPEKRDFFLEGSDTFDFTQGGTRLFYSRRIGISPDRREIPILGGAKLIQKSGGYRLGVLSMQTDAADSVPSTNYTVGRIRKDVLEQSYVGFIATSVMDREGHDNQLIAGDFIYRTNNFPGNKNFEIQGYFAGTATDGEIDDPAGRLFFRYPNDVIDSFILYHQIDPKFNPEVGFVSRTGIRNFIYTIDYRPRTSIPYLKRFVFMPLWLNYTTGMDYWLLTRDIEIIPFGFETNSGDEFNITYNNNYDYVERDFTFFTNVPVEKGAYNWQSWEAEIETARQRRVVMELDYEKGGYFDGDRTNYGFEMTYRPIRFFSISGDAEYNDFKLSGRDFITREYGSRLNVDFNTRLNSSAFIQWNNELREVNMYYRIHYIPRIGSDLYIVYNHLMDESRRYADIRKTAMIKVNYTFRL